MICKYAEIFCWKNVSSFCSAKATHIFSAKNIRILYIESAKTVNEMTLNELVKLTTLWTTGPWIFLLKNNYISLDKMGIQLFLISSQKICCGCLTETLHWGFLCEYQQCMFLCRNKTKYQHFFFFHLKSGISCSTLVVTAYTLSEFLCWLCQLKKCHNMQSQNMLYIYNFFRKFFFLFFLPSTETF